MFAAATAGLAIRQLSGTRAPDLHRWPRRTAVFQVAFLTAIPLFLLKDSYDYRLVLWLPCLALPFAWLRIGAADPVWRRFGIIAVALFLFVSGVELPCTWLDSLAVSTGRQWPVVTATLLSYAKQFAAWALAALLCILFIETLRQRFHRRAVVSS